MEGRNLYLTSQKPHVNTLNHVHVHVLRRWRSETVCIFMNQTETNWVVLMIKYISKAAWTRSCVYPMVFTACARLPLQKKTSILHETVPFLRSFSTFGDVCMSALPIRRVDFLSWEKDLMFWKRSLLIYFWLKGLWCLIVSVLLPLLWCSCPLAWLPSSREQLEVWDPDLINTAVDIGGSREAASRCRLQEPGEMWSVGSTMAGLESALPFSPDAPGVRLLISLSFSFDSIQQSVLRTKLERKGTSPKLREHVQPPLLLTSHPLMDSL